MRFSESNKDGFDILMTPRRLGYKISSLRSKRADLQSMLMPGSMDYSKDKVQSAHGDKMADIQAEIYDIDIEIEEMTKKKYLAHKQAVEAIEALESETEKTVLTMWFIGCKSMEIIMDEIGYSRSQTYEIRKQGLKHIGRNKKCTQEI